MSSETIVHPDMHAMRMAAEVAAVIRRGRFDLMDEKRTQEQIGDVLTAAAIPYQRECHLSSADIVDFLVAETLAVEVKIKGTKRAIYRQLERYAGHDCVHAILLLTANSMPLPLTIAGKPAAVASLSIGWL
jgi:hypothetical protein